MLQVKNELAYLNLAFLVEDKEMRIVSIEKVWGHRVLKLY